jgi:putative oxygen-independent coproporphyrinogen III oxidase
VDGPRPPEGLYVHFPFCLSLCPYCDFVVVAGAAARGPRNRIAPFLEALTVELELRADAVVDAFGGERPALTSVYLGGGTPSLMAPAQVAALLEAVDRRLGLAADVEITIEANPGPDEIGDLAGLHAAGVTRISIGAQSMDPAELRRLGRRHRPGHVVAAVEASRQAGFEDISLDLLTDVPGQTVASWRASLEAVLALEPEHLSTYALTLDDPDAEGLTGPEGDHLPLSRGARAWRERALPEQSEERAVQMELLTDELVREAGLRRYEIANVARPGHESRHNLLYWRRRPYLAIGPGAHASDGAARRWWNAARLDGYVGSLARRALPPGGAEEVDQATAIAEAAILGLRLREGIEPSLAASPVIAEGLAWARDFALIEDHGERVRLTARGRLLSNEVFARLLPEEPFAAGPGEAT